MANIQLCQHLPPVVESRWNMQWNLFENGTWRHMSPWVTVHVSIRDTIIVWKQVVGTSMSTVFKNNPSHHYHPRVMLMKSKGRWHLRPLPSRKSLNFLSALFPPKLLLRAIDIQSITAQLWYSLEFIELSRKIYKSIQIHSVKRPNIVMYEND